MPLKSRLTRTPQSVDEAADAASSAPPQDVSPRKRRLPPEPPAEDHTATHEAAEEEAVEEVSGDTDQQPNVAAPIERTQTPADGVAAKVGRGRKSASRKAAAVLPDDIAEIEDEATARAMVKQVESEIKDARAAYDAQVASLRKRFLQANEKLAELLGG